MENTTANSYNLSIRISSDGFSLLVTDGSGLQLSTKKVTASVFSLSAEEITNIIEKETQLNFHHIRIICETDIYIFVPMPLFRTGEAVHFLNFQHKAKKNERVIYNTIPTWNTVNVFSIPGSLLQALTDLFPGQAIEHHMSSFLSDKIKPQQENSLSIWARQQMADLIIIKEGKLQLLNSFSYQTAEDFCFHALNAMEQLSLDTNKHKVFLYNATKKPELEKVLENYVTIINN